MCDTKPLKTFMSEDNARAQETMGELTQFKEVRIIVLPNFNKAADRETIVIEREDVPIKEEEAKEMHKKLIEVKKSN